ncbi:ATP-binding protein [Mucilaginibacter sp.]|uniref:hybrid sensor histidine kinase/response regulator n=1 Tax=Mucilaginibacter sp. TaxID=1882438 RepID=UPI003D0D5A65
MRISENYLLQTDLQAGYWEWDMKGEIPFNDPGLVERLGYDEQDLNGGNGLHSKIPADGLELLRSQIKRHIESHAEIPFAQEIWLLDDNSDPQCYLFTGKILQWGLNNEPLLMMGNYVNITRQRELLGELTRIKGFLNKTNQAAMIGSWEIDMDTQKVNWTAITRSIFGVPPDFEPERGNFIHFFKEEDQPKLQEAFHLAYTEGKPYDLELKVVNALGEELWTRTIGQPEFENGQCKRVYGIFQDISKQKRTEEKLRMKQAQLEAFIGAAPAALAMLDRSFNYIAASKIWMRSYNIDVATIIGKNHLEVFHEISEEWKDYMRRCLNGESFKMEEDPFTRRDGKIEWLRWEIKPWYEAPGQVGGIILFTDLITEKIMARKELIKAKEDAEIALLAKSRFLSVMSHEIRTPMNAVIGFCNLLMENPREDQQEYLRLLKFSADNLMVIINDILNLSKIEEGMVNLESVDFNLKELLENIYTINKQVVNDKKIGLTLNYAPSLPLFIKGDVVRLGQIITNLVNNAIKFTSAGGVTISIDEAGQDADNVSIKFEIKDTGIGIPADKQDYVFEIFTQASSETTRKFGGIGLGLAICRKLVNLMGGKINIESREWEGSAFSFILKFKKGNIKQVDTSGKLDYKTSTALNGVRLLLAEDNPVNVLVVKRYLQQWGVECDVAENGEMALQMFPSKKYDMVLMDLQMPVMDGYEASKKIRLMPGNEQAMIPIVAITASLVGDIWESIVESGMNDYLCKPFKPSELHDIIKKYTIDSVLG